MKEKITRRSKQQVAYPVITCNFCGRKIATPANITKVELSAVYTSRTYEICSTCTEKMLATVAKTHTKKEKAALVAYNKQHKST